MRWDRTSTEFATHSIRADAGLEVVPVSVGGRRPIAGLIVAIAIAAALGLAIVEPWAPAASPASEPAPAPIAMDSLSATAPSGDRQRVPRGSDPVASADRAIRVTDWTRLAADADRLEGQPIVTARDLGGTDGDGTCGGAARITPFDELIAISAPPGERVANVRLFAIDTLRRPDVPVRIVPDRPGPLDGRPADGLTLVALPRGGIAARQYALITGTIGPTGAGLRIYTVCVG